MDRTNMVKDYGFYSHLDQRQMEYIEQETKFISYKRGTVIHRGDEDCMGLLRVISGELRIYMVSESGKEITLYRLEQGDVCTLSASCILGEITFDVFIETMQQSELMILPLPVINRLKNENVYVENYLYKMTMERFSDVMWAMQQILFMSLDKRLAIFLLDESIRQGDTLTLTHEQIAKYMGSAREVVSRMVKYFEKEGYIEAKRGCIVIKEAGKLREIASNE